jgi:hypothetical protein
LRFAAFVPAVVAAGMLADVATVAMSRCLVALLVLPAFIAVAASRAHCGAADYLRALWRPALATLCMTAVLRYASDGLDGGHGVRLVSLLLAGAVVYVVVLWGCWIAAGRPPGPEQEATAFLRRRLKP